MKLCAHCSRDLEMGMNYCPGCGERVDAQEQEQAPHVSHFTITGISAPISGTQHAADSDTPPSDASGAVQPAVVGFTITGITPSSRTGPRVAQPSPSPRGPHISIVNAPRGPHINITHTPRPAGQTAPRFPVGEPQPHGGIRNTPHTNIPAAAALQEAASRISDRIGVSLEFLVSIASTVALGILFLMHWVVVTIPAVYGIIDFYGSSDMNSLRQTQSLGVNTLTLFSQEKKVESLFTLFNNSGANTDSTLTLFNSISGLVLLLSIVVFALLAASLIVHRSPLGKPLACAGFGLCAVLCAACVVGVWSLQSYISQQLGASEFGLMAMGINTSFVTLTLAPYIACLLSVASLVFVLKYPRH